MTMARPPALDHLVFYVADLERTRRFYEAFLGPLDFHTGDTVMFLIGETRLFFIQAELLASVTERDRPGFNHVAFRVGSLDELQQFAARLDEAAIQHSGIQMDRYGGREFLWLDDPDRLRVEFYLRDELQC